VNKVIKTYFLNPNEWFHYGDWLKKQDPETLQNYFGNKTKDHSIDLLMNRITQFPNKNYLLIATQNNHWVGVTHIAIHDQTVEFGLIVDPQYRKQGIASLMIEEAITWSRNRYYQYLYMHCIGWNTPIKKICLKHNLQTKNMMGESEVKMKLSPPDFVSLLKEHGSNLRKLVVN
jgi:GNAT superfamily N-acetyltransferase